MGGGVVLADPAERAVEPVDRGADGEASGRGPICGTTGARGNGDGVAGDRAGRGVELFDLGDGSDVPVPSPHPDVGSDRDGVGAVALGGGPGWDRGGGVGPGVDVDAGRSGAAEAAEGAAGQAEGRGEFVARRVRDRRDRCRVRVGRRVDDADPHRGRPRSRGADHDDATGGLVENRADPVAGEPGDGTGDGVGGGVEDVDAGETDDHVDVRADGVAGVAAAGERDRERRVGERHQPLRVSR